jgi:hypothetical protein
VPEPFIAIVLGLLIGVAVNIFSINPGTLRNMQVCPLPQTTFPVLGIELPVA